MIMRFLDWLAVRLGRKFAFVDFYGDVGFYRYYIFYVERHDARNWIAKFIPNLYIHHFPGEPSGQGPDGDMPHFHPWNTLSVMLTGGYTEQINHTMTRVSKAPALVYLSHKQSHRLVKATPGTWTLFFHGPRKQEWLVDEKVHAVICEPCKKHNNGVCANQNRTRPVDPAIEITCSSQEARGWRKAKWIMVDAEFDALILERKEQLKKGRIPTPGSAFLKIEVLKNEILKSRLSNVQE
jgi:hypothetical protein